MLGHFAAAKDGAISVKRDPTDDWLMAHYMNGWGVYRLTASLAGTALQAVLCEFFQQPTDSAAMRHDTVVHIGNRHIFLGQVEHLDKPHPSNIPVIPPPHIEPHLDDPE